MEYTILLIRFSICEEVITLCCMKSTNLLIHIPESELATHKGCHSTYFSTRDYPLTLVDKTMPSGNIYPRNCFYSMYLLIPKKDNLIFFRDSIYGESIFQGICICKNWYPFFITIKPILLRQFCSCSSTLIGWNKSWSQWEWRGNHFDYLSRWCRWDMFVASVYEPTRIKRKIVKPENQWTMSKEMSIGDGCMKEWERERWLSMYAKVINIMNGVYWEYILIQLKKFNYLRHRVCPNIETTCVWVLSVESCDKFTGKSHITSIVDDIDKYVYNSWGLHACNCIDFS